MSPAAETPQPAPLPAVTPAMNAMDSAEPFRLAILTPSEFAGALQTLADFKTKTGIPTRIITLEEIYTKCSGRDQAEQVKNCLAGLANVNQIHYAMLVGDVDKFPVRYTKADRAASEAGNTAFFATDLYYADLFKADGTFDNWDLDQDGYYGEICGEITTYPLNSDEVDLIPDIAVGRIPASNLTEVERYIKKDINYETSSFNSDWAKKVMLIGTTTWVPDTCKYMEEIGYSLPEGYSTVKLYESGSSRAGDGQPSTQAILDLMEKGVGFISYMGHGDNTGWYQYLTNPDVCGLTGASPASIVFAASCGTSEFAPRPPSDAYTDANGMEHIGNTAGEVFSSVPPPPANIQRDTINGFGEAITVQSDGGAVAYVGAITGAQEFSIFLDMYFFEAISAGRYTVGDMWVYMVEKYYQRNTFPKTVDPPNWVILAQFHQPWKFMLFGDPSLRIGGVSMQ
jgi:hypothetical protein